MRDYITRRGGYCLVPSGALGRGDWIGSGLLASWPRRAPAPLTSGFGTLPSARVTGRRFLEVFDQHLGALADDSPVGAPAAAEGELEDAVCHLHRDQRDLTREVLRSSPAVTRRSRARSASATLPAWAIAVTAGDTRPPNHRRTNSGLRSW